MRTLITIKPLPNYLLECLFNDGSRMFADIKPYLDKVAFKPLIDSEVFESALHNGGYFVELKNYEVDLSADTFWYISTKA